MTRYFFNLVDGKHSAIDKHGKEFDSLSEAHLHALRMFAKLIEFIPDQISPACRIRITLSTRGAGLDRIPAYPCRSGQASEEGRLTRQYDLCEAV